MTPIELLVLQPTGFCNIDCDYCYLPKRGRNSKARMSDDLLERIASEILASDHVTQDTLVLWHGGEPLSLPLAWYKSAQATLLRPGRSVRFQFQSNGLLLDEKWARFFRETRSSIGLSIDGPDFIHDRKRKDRNGVGTFVRVLQTVELLQKSDIEFTNIATVTEHCLDHADAIFDFFYGLRPAKLAFSIEEAEGANVVSTLYRPDLVCEPDHDS